MDISDQATATEELDRRIALGRRQPAAPPHSGRCLNCGDKVEAPRRWCDADCRDDWQTARARKTIH